MNRVARTILLAPGVRAAVGRIIGKKGAPLFLNLVLHAEKIFHDGVYPRLLELPKHLAFRPTLCVMTPKNPYIRREMEKEGMRESAFTERLERLRRDYHIGFHGHWCGGDRCPGHAAPYRNGVSTGIETEGFRLTFDSPAEIERQLREECGYLAPFLDEPGVYCGGWWRLNGAIVAGIERYGFRVDCSVRYGRADRFGDTYVPPAALPPQGVPFVLAGSNAVLEIPSAFYLHMNWWTVARDVYGMLRRTDRPLYCVLPIHDYDLVEYFDVIVENVRFLSALRNVQWRGIRDMEPGARTGVPA